MHLNRDLIGGSEIPEDRLFLITEKKEKAQDTPGLKAVMLQLVVTAAADYSDAFGNFSSGKPAADVSRDRIPASAAVDPTNTQFISDIATVVPMVATAVCAMVFTALIPAALTHFNK